MSPDPSRLRKGLTVKEGRSLQDLAAELQRQNSPDIKRDFVAPQGKVEVRVVEGQLVLDGLNGDAKPVTRFAARQFADHLGIPQKYFDRMHAEQPELLANNIRTWLHANGAEKRMFRTLDGNVRAFLSPKYRALDNFELASAVLPVLAANKVQVLSSELTETRMYIKGILPELSDKVPTGAELGRGHDRIYGEGGAVVAAIVISNSEVGNGTLRIEPSVFTTFCTNLMILKAAAMKKYHVGRAFSAEEDFSLYRDATRQADDAAFFMKVRDVAEKAFDRDAFKAAVAELRRAMTNVIESPDLPTVVEVTTRQLALPERSQSSILTALAKGGDLSQWGLSSAITEVANTTADYEEATILERAGGEVLALAPRDWEAIAKAVAEKK